MEEDGFLRLTELREIAQSFDRHDLADEASALSIRVAERRFFVACLGQFKRGKSSVLNALIGEKLLPVGVVPVTAIVTIVRHGTTSCAKVRIGSDAWIEIATEELASYVSEAENPGNRKNVTGVEVFRPSPLLASGLCLVDTPGLGSVFASNTEATRSFVPQIDAAFVVIGADPPLSGEELELATEVAAQTERIVFALNKADRMSAEDLVEAKRFTLDVLRERVGRDIPLFEVSAREKLDTGLPTREWAALETYLRDLAAHAGAGLVRTAAARGARRIGAALQRDVHERRGALMRPREDSLRRIEDLRVAIERAEQQLDDMSYLFNAVQDRLRLQLERERKAFWDTHIAVAQQELRERVTVEAGHRDLPDLAMTFAREIARAHIESWRAAIEERIEANVVEASARFVELAQRFLADVSDSDDPALSSLQSSFMPEVGFTVKSGFWFADLLSIGDAPLAVRLGAALRTSEARVEMALPPASAYLDRLLETNSHRVANDFIEQAFESRRRLQTDLRAHLRHAITASQTSLAHAERITRAGRPAVEAALTSLESFEATLQRLAAEHENGTPCSL